MSRTCCCSDVPGQESLLRGRVASGSFETHRRTIVNHRTTVGPSPTSGDPPSDHRQPAVTHHRTTIGPSSTSGDAPSDHRRTIVGPSSTSGDPPSDHRRTIVNQRSAWAPAPARQTPSLAGPVPDAPPWRGPYQAGRPLAIVLTCGPVVCEVCDAIGAALVESAPPAPSTMRMSLIQSRPPGPKGAVYGRLRGWCRQLSAGRALRLSGVRRPLEHRCLVGLLLRLL
ncbi:unnamed protein product [Boreogadus saida]